MVVVVGWTSLFVWMLMRERLHDYEGFNDEGSPVLEPWQVPPVVSQHLPYLRPTGRNKMFNARIESSGDAGHLRDFYGLPPRGDITAKEANYELLRPLLQKAQQLTTFTAGKRKPEDNLTTFDALVGVISAEEFMNAFKQMRWHEDYRKKVFEPTLRFYEKLTGNGRLDRFVIIWPRLTKLAVDHGLPGLDDAQIITRSRRAAPRIDFVGSDAKHRDATERIVGAPKTSDDVQANALRDPAGKTAAVLFYLAADNPRAGDGRCNAADLIEPPAPGDLATLMSIAAPATATPHGRSVIEWTVRRGDQTGVPTIIRP